MPSRKQVLCNFIDSIPDHKLENAISNTKVLTQDGNFHLDMQGKTTNGQLNLQIQCVKRPETKSFNEWSTETVSGPAFVATDEPLDGDAIRQVFKDTIVDFNDTSQQRGKGSRARKHVKNVEEETEEPGQGDGKGKQKNKAKKNNKYGKW
ncbi:hypothetical protein CDV36_003735 [Fusarium kuroshium]|uniref:Uncharacterized protein n=2 Tax=Fusarium solani species complex TaxID=232080 RepID=A0A3M2SGF1_9HYPO|nr:hypothetical protein CDV36_003735 [Fusarium kuroshium]RSL88422.1 hypothetical protein CEP51_001765 [Fusarium floridanum]